MTTELFNEWLVSLNSDMKREKQHIILFLDNCTVHNNAPPLSNGKLQFSPPNSTSKLQALDQGIIHNFKTFYRSEVVKSALYNLENQQNVTTIYILTVLIMIDKAWRAVTPLTIHSCFKKSGFPSPNLVDVDYTLTEFNAEPSLWETLPEQDYTFDDYVLVDTDIAEWGALSDAEIVALNHNNTESDEDELEKLTPVTLSEAKVSLNKLRNFSPQNHVDADILQASLVQEKSIDKVRLNALKQKKREQIFSTKKINYIHWCAKIKDEVEKLAYQLNEEAERTERPIRRLSKVMYGSTCADMQVDVMGECLSSIKHVVGVRSVFLAKRLHAV
ncbi:tigger transposable element-derived protein 6 [Trichonephila clavipes]|nr:tigger transposable element-derived protein 6 [Trichonephila clavipes]